MHGRSSISGRSSTGVAGLVCCSQEEVSGLVAKGIDIFSMFGCSKICSAGEICSASGCYSGTTSVLCSEIIGSIFISAVYVIACSVVGCMGSSASNMIGLTVDWLRGEEISLNILV